MSSSPSKTAAARASSAGASGVPAEAGLVRQLYGQGVPLTEIARRTGLSTTTLYRWIDRRVSADGTVVFDPLPRRRPPVVGAKAAANGAGRAGRARARLLARLWFAAERQVDEIEARMGEAPPGDVARRVDAEKDAKALALLTRTLRELAAIEDEARGTKGRGKGSARKGATGTEGDTNGADVRDRDAFRRELARRLDRLRGEGPGETSA